MKPSETFHFDEAEYIKHIENRNFSYTTLAREIYIKRRNRLSTTVRAGVSIAAVPFSGGISALGVALAGRNISVESRKLMLLEVEWARRGQIRLPERQWRQKIVTVAITVGTTMFLVGVDIGVGGVIAPDTLVTSALPAVDLQGYIISECINNSVGHVGEMVFDKAEEEAQSVLYTAPIHTYAENLYK